MATQQRIQISDWLGSRSWVVRSLHSSLLRTGMLGAGIVLGSLPYQAATAQNITLDGTLGAQNNIAGPNYLIQQDFGTTVQENLFHSFERFNLDAGESARFESDLTIQNIFSRVTGGEASSINGEIVTSSPAVNLFLINPSGILFGPNASLNIGGATRGSFIATTTDGLVWPNQGQFNAVTPVDSQGLLNLIGDPSGFVASQRAIPSIEIQGSQLAVAPGQSLLLAAGSISLDGAALSIGQTEGGNIELATVADTGTVSLNVEGNLWSQQLPETLARGDIRLANSKIEVAAASGGNLSLYGNNIEISGESQLLAGIPDNLGAPGSQAGDVQIDAQTELVVTDESLVANDLFGTGAAGDLVIVAPVVKVDGGSRLSARSYGQGNAGNVQISARDRVLLDGTSEGGLISTGVFSSMELGSFGDSGNIVVDTSILEVTGGALLAADSISQAGNGGDITISARERVILQGATPNDDFPSGIVSDVGFFGSITDGELPGGTFSGRGFVPGDIIGNSGNILIETGVLEVLEGGAISAGMFFGTGNAGRVTLRASERLRIEGVTANIGFPSAIFAWVASDGVGNGGNIAIETPVLEVVAGGLITTENFGEGNAGEIQIVARDRASFQGTSPDERFASTANATSFSDMGGAGKIVVETALLEILDGALIGASLFGEGNPGNIQILASDGIRLRGSSPNGELPGGIVSSGIARGTGDGGNIVVETSWLEILEGAAISVNAFGDGSAGSIQVLASDRILLDGAGSGGISSAIFANNGLPDSEFQGTGAGGDIFIAAPQLTLSNGAVLSAQTINDQAGGSIRLNLDRLEVLSGGQIFTVSSSSGAAGSISIVANEQIRISGRDPLFADRLAKFGSNVDPISELSLLSVQSSGTGLAGDIILNTGNLILENSGQIIAEASSGRGGSIFIGENPSGGPAIAPEITLLRNNGLISATAGNDENPGDGGNINIITPFLIGFPNDNSDLIANAFRGTGGQINITANNIFNFNLADNPIAEQLRQNTANDISASSQFGNSGTITLDTLDVDPADSLNELPTDLVDGSQVIAQNLCRDGRGSEFIVTGRGGLPAPPQDTFQPEAEWEDWRFSEALVAVSTTSLTQSGSRSQLPLPAQSKAQPRPAKALREAQTWRRSPSGSIQLMASSAPTPPLNPQLSCRGLRANHLN